MMYVSVFFILFGFTVIVLIFSRVVWVFLFWFAINICSFRLGFSFVRERDTF